MDSADLSAWIGKPSGKPKLARQEDTDELESQSPSKSGSRSEHSVGESSVEVAGCDEDEEMRQADADHTEDEDAWNASGLEDEETEIDRAEHRPHCKFIIDIPPVNNKEEYEYLPGHFYIQRVVSEHSHNKYVVRLGSGEQDLVCPARPTCPNA